MSVRLRLRRTGTRNKACFRIVATDKRSPRDGRFIEIIGYYDPRNQDEKIDLERTEYWLSNGAQPSDTVASIIRRAKDGTPLKQPVSKAQPEITATNEDAAKPDVVTKDEDAAKTDEVTKDNDDAKTDEVTKDKDAVADESASAEPVAEADAPEADESDSSEDTQSSDEEAESCDAGKKPATDKTAEDSSDELKTES